MLHPTDPPRSAENDLPIEVYSGEFIYDSGLVSLPVAFFRYYPYLEFQGERLTDGEAMLLAQVLALRVKNAAGEYALRGSNLPRVSHHPRSLERAKAKLRQLGLLFTRRLYYPSRAGQAPVMRAQQWDVRPLFHNLARLHRLWLKGQQQSKAQWQAAGRSTPQPVYQFPEDFTLATDIPLEVAFDLCRHKTYRGQAEYVIKPVPEAWRQRAHTICQAAGINPAGISVEAELPYPPPLSGTANPGASYQTNLSGTTKPGMPHTTDLASHLVKDSEEEEEEESPLSANEFDRLVLEHLRSAGGQTSPKDAATLRKLREQHCSLPAIRAAVDEAAARQARGVIRTFNLAYCAKIALNGSRPLGAETSESGEARRRPSRVRESADPTAAPGLEAVASPASELALPAVVALCQAAGRPLTQAQHAVLASEAQAAHVWAVREGETGVQWVFWAVQAALAADARHLTGYALKTVRDWIHRGRPVPAVDRRAAVGPAVPPPPDDRPPRYQYVNEP